MTPTADWPRLLLLTDRAQLPLGRSLVATIGDCAAAGATHVVVREHDLSSASRHALLAALCDIAGLTVISSRTADPAAHAVQLAGHQDVHAAGRGWFGRSCHSAADVAHAAAEGASYAVLSPFATTPSKPGHGPPLAPEAYAEAAADGIPVHALGGIDPANAQAARAAGAHGVAVMGAVMRAPDPGDVVRRLLREVGQ